MACVSLNCDQRVRMADLKAGDRVATIDVSSGKRIFDTIVVLSAIMEEVLSASTSATAIRVLRIMRLVRVIRVVRVLRVVCASISHNQGEGSIRRAMRPSTSYKTARDGHPI